LGITKIDFVSRGRLPPHMVESHHSIYAMQGGEHVPENVDGSHGGVGREAWYRAVVVEKVAEYFVSRGCLPSHMVESHPAVNTM